MRMNTFTTITAACILAFILTSCFVPAKFNSTIIINNNGSYEFTYDGTIVFLLARAKEVKFGKLPEGIEKDMHDMVSQLKEDTGFSKVEYIGNSKFKVSYKKKGSLDEPFHFLASDAKIFSIIPKSNGEIVVKGKGIGKSDLKKINALNIQIDGKLTVKTNGEVVSQNGKKAKKLFSNYTSYIWKFRSLNDSPPKITIQTKHI